MKRHRGIVALVFVAMLSRGAAAGGQTAQGPDIDGGSPRNAAIAIDGPPPPALPETVARDAQGRATIRAVRLSAPLRVDGRLDESVYQSVIPVSDFIQTEPEEGVPATQVTEVWVMFDERAVYVAFRCHESNPERMVLNEMRRDSFNLVQNDGVSFMFDTYYDRRNGVSFIITPLGGRMEGQITNERGYNVDWNPIWSLATGRFDGGWVAETAIPFKSLRYRPGHEQVWGFQVNRRNRWKNEISFLTPVPNSVGQRGVSQVSLAATLVGIEAPSGSRNLEIKPYAIGDLTTDLVASPKVANDPGGDVGVDVKYGVTQNLTLDFTYNTDFAQVEADEQQVNLTRFSLFFPEKRDFFLENQGMFQFGGGSGFGGQGGGGGGFGGGPVAPSEAPVLFYSRRIGLNGGRQIPIDGGGRLTGRIGKFSVGLLDIQADDEPASATPATNFSALRIKRDVLRRSSVGLIATRRSHAAADQARGSNEAYGVDAALAFFTNLSINTYWARTRTEGLASEDDVSYQAQIEYLGDRYGVQLERLTVGDNFNPDMGFLRRDDMRRTFGLFRFSPRPHALPAVRKLSWIGSMAHIEDGAGRLETREVRGEFGIEFENSDRLTFVYTDSYEFLEAPFEIASDVAIPVGAYSFGVARASLSMGQQHPVAGNIEVERGTFFGGERTTVAFTRGRVELTPRFSLEPNVSLNWVDLPVGAFTTKLASSRVTYTISPMMFVSALLQYNTSTHLVSANARLRWEYQPGSELFVVFNEERDTLSPRFPGLRNRSFIVKVNRLFRL